MLIKTAAPSVARPSRGGVKATAESSPERSKAGLVDQLVRDHPVLSAGVLGSVGYTAASVHPSTWLHEMGHATAIKQLYTNGRPTVEVFPLKGGVTRWYPSELSPLGKKLGPDAARALVAASGTLVDVGVATTTFGAGFAMRKKHPIVGAALMGYGAMTIGNSVAYAASALGGDLAALSAKGNDFATIAVKGGLHPLASMAILASILPLQYAAMKWIENSGQETGEQPPSVFAAVAPQALPPAPVPSAPALAL
jgi:hypothetical protein